MFFKRKEKKRKKDNFLLLQRLNGREVKYVSVRDPDTYTETIIGKNGYINIYGDKLFITCEGKEVFSRPLDSIKAGEFMSLNGVNLKYFDTEQNKELTVVAYYKYHRK